MPLNIRDCQVSTFNRTHDAFTPEIYIFGHLSIVESSREDRRRGFLNRRRPGNAAARRYQQRSNASTSRAPQLMRESDFESLSEGSDDDGSARTDSEAKPVMIFPKKKIGTKKAQKLAEKERRKEEREMEERYREAMRKKEDEEIKKRKDAEAREAAAEAAQVSLLFRATLLLRSFCSLSILCLLCYAFESSTRFRPTATMNELNVVAYGVV